MRKPFKFALFVLILPILTFDFVSYNYIAAQELNARYILPQVVKSATTPVSRKIIQSRNDLCAQTGCTKA